MKVSKVESRLRSGRALAAGTSLLAVALAASPAMAQENEGASTQGSEGNRNIVVTGSRIQTDGMAAPVPVTVVAADEIEALSPGALITGVSQLPQFYGNQTPNSGNFFVRSGYGTLNLRGLGVNRTLTLLNGRRVPSTSAFGGVDINLFPEAMIQSVETTTGGASAAYGSDAVAGVVNFVLDTNYTGLELSAQGGITSRDDGENYELSAAYGTSFADGRGHFLISGEYYDQEGIFTYNDRDWYQSVGTFGSGTEADPYRFVANTVSANASFDGRIFAPGTAIHEMVFDRGGNVSPYTPGSESQFPYGIPPARTAGGGNDDLGAEAPSLYPDLERYSIFTYADFELSDNFMVFGQYLHGRTSIWQYNSPRASFGGTPTALTIFQDNAFLPDDLRQTMIDEGIESFTLRRMGSLEDIGTMYLDDETTQHIGTAGFSYEMDNGWSIDGFYQYGHSKRDWRQFGLRVDRIFAAIDAVEDPSTGEIVCRVSLFGDAFPGCEPLNLFGRGNASAAAIDYVTGFEPGQSITTPIAFADDGFASGRSYSYTTSAEKVNITTFEQHFAELSASGDLVDLWAGPLAVAVGGSYRRDEILQLVQDVTNPASDHIDGHPVLCNDEAPGLRGVSTPDCLNTVGIQYSKVSNIKGNAEVWELFGEFLLPLYDSDGVGVFANGAVRWADYSGSGSIWAYKGGLELELGDLRVRGTYSRDVRAGNLSERFDRTGGAATIDDPRTPDIEAINVTRFSGGNPAVNPEEADTFTIGAVFQPSFIPGLSLSLDYYDISIDGAISQVGNQSVLDRCFLESAQEFCDLITLTSGIATPSADGDIVLVGDVFVNVAQSAVRGIDFEMGYTTPLSLLGGDESLSGRVFASWLLERSETNSSGVTTDFAGQTGATQNSGVQFPYADFKLTGSLTYRNDGFSGLVQVRHIGEGVQDISLTEGVTIEDNTVSAATYVDLRLGYQFDIGGAEMEIFGNVTNLFDEDPPLTPSYSAFLGYSSQYNASVYDVLGTRYTVGVRLRM
ncbi:TonB-dependent receptor plug domain-containing protein [Aurantiacibacter sp. MUD11]|uniref:TonB-dependent receptor plug domain-containing protein n=1 Tax=Aurantiacibacter sp. MUD11 TaxID=3003265 RepID=UPI0022AA84BD|nr:TonB-dependent receptor plug domain-containing protein [Aurantiacibacter sp. MUD11]WAT17474.1 TonB-dependent receptor plug domain-containing protein [Aurantiacibacter sp. MUD11]